jgi:hypothetical protein
MDAQQGQHLTVPRGQRYRSAFDAKQRVVPAEQLQAVAVKTPDRTGVPVDRFVSGGGGRYSPSCHPVPLRSGQLKPLHAQLGLRSGHGRLDEGQGVRGDCHLGAGNIQDPDHGTGIRIAEGDRRAAPGMDSPVEMLGAGDLDAAAQRQGGPGGARADAGLGPVRALNKHHALRAPAQGSIAVDPQQPAQFIPDSDEQPVFGAGLNQQPMYQRHD